MVSAGALSGGASFSCGAGFSCATSDTANKHTANAMSFLMVFGLSCSWVREGDASFPAFVCRTDVPANIARNPRPPRVTGAGLPVWEGQRGKNDEKIKCYREAASYVFTAVQYRSAYSASIRGKKSFRAHVHFFSPSSFLFSGSATPICDKR